MKPYIKASFNMFNARLMMNPWPWVLYVRCLLSYLLWSC